MFNVLSKKSVFNLRRLYGTHNNVVFKGSSSSPGFYRGRACIITDPSTQTEKFKFGEVLVCRHVHSQWNDLLHSSGAIVIELDTKISHGPMIARRLGIPCVSELSSSIWDYIQDGDELIVRANTGEVEVVGKVENPDKPILPFKQETIVMDPQTMKEMLGKR
eukprot:TRINITY_DN26215_c0_g1_i1.p1 TRINITY_DN26215_c0_g1~~TRINITY_DN26215_c0_g1_i1.p1  ORF type:complete len:162 (+),score=27.10 TRINITY_DN26215_c0_g1_i1:58-543(+)